MNHEIVSTSTVTTDDAIMILSTWESQAGYWELRFRKHEYRKIDDIDWLISVQCECTDQRGLDEPVDGKWWLINEHTVIEGIKRILAGGVANCRPEIANMLADGAIDGCDADQADAIVQAGLFGELVYG